MPVSCHPLLTGLLKVPLFSSPSRELLAGLIPSHAHFNRSYSDRDYAVAPDSPPDRVHIHALCVHSPHILVLAHL